MRAINQAERLILKDVLTSTAGVHAYTFWRRYLISPSQVTRVIKRFVGKGILEFDGSRITFTQKGRKWGIKNRANLYAMSHRPWRQCPEEFMQPQLSINQPIAPSISMLDKSLLPPHML
jgi:hypothetical protein